MAYRYRNTVEAVQFCGTKDYAKLVEFIGPAFHKVKAGENGMSVHIVLFNNGRKIDLQDGCWLVHCPIHGYSVYTDDTFRKEFEELPEYYCHENS